jgi:hypothetical protein
LHSFIRSHLYDQIFNTLSFQFLWQFHQYSIM